MTSITLPEEWGRQGRESAPQPNEGYLPRIQTGDIKGVLLVLSFFVYGSNLENGTFQEAVRLPSKCCLRGGLCPSICPYECLAIVSSTN